MDARLVNAMQQLGDENLLELDKAKSAGRPIVGFYCLYSPVELAVAAGAAVLPLCGTRNDPIAAAEEILPRNLCPLIKSSFGFASTGSCPYFQAAGLIVGDTTCDGKKKMFELLDAYRPTHVMQLPSEQESEDSRRLWRAEVERLKKRIEAYAGREITDGDLRQAVALLNRERAARKNLMDVNRLQPAPLRGSELVTVLFKIGFLLDKERGIAAMNEVAQTMREEHRKGGGDPRRKRILLTGVPVGLGSDKVVQIVEQCGADIVAMENCSGYKQTFRVEEEGDPMANLAAAYLATPCSVMSPNPGRFAMLEEMITGFAVDGVIDLTWQACHTYNIEAYRVERFVTETFSKPTLHLETDYATSDSEQLRVRIEAYLEML